MMVGTVSSRRRRHEVPKRLHTNTTRPLRDSVSFVTSTVVCEEMENLRPRTSRSPILVFVGRVVSRTGIG